ncbi:hypothetical protein [Candidatus Palauibacter sp.]
MDLVRLSIPLDCHRVADPLVCPVTIKAQIVAVLDDVEQTVQVGA